ncbi:NAD(P)/FAD-dependent oxidoreductase [Microterricola viridarii]|uniref:NAD(P)/FAD-dependent oxidoreductase n=1 Tax=Microterricola viridarii TaxID=412690 RepID=UPI0018D3C737|nr:FAD-binding oxidoreductase [Microterricola viridarii]
MPVNSPAPRRVAIVGAGMVGLATAWHLQEHGVEVTVLEREGVAAGASWGNAGWLAPGMAMPLSDPSLWAYGPRAMLDPAAPLSIPLRVDPTLWSFLTRFISRATNRAWAQTMDALTGIDLLALEAFDELVAGGVQAETKEQPFIIGFEKEEQSRHFRHEMELVERAGQSVPLTTVENPRQLVPQLTDAVRTVLALGGQRFMAPGDFVEALAQSVRERGGVIDTTATVTRATRRGNGVVAELGDGRSVDADAIVLANGAWLPGLAREHGVRTLVQAGRGYSFSVATDQPAEYPIYFPNRRVACTPFHGRLRIAGTMEFRRPDEPLRARRIDDIVNSVRPLFTNMDLDDRQDEWVGSRPVTPDGLPLVGATATPGVYVAGGHGMWGIVLGPATGKLLAQQMMTGVVAPQIAPFDPLR